MVPEETLVLEMITCCFFFFFFTMWGQLFLIYWPKSDAVLQCFVCLTLSEAGHVWL